jgi:hypothetical protein
MLNDRLEMLRFFSIVNFHELRSKTGLQFTDAYQIVLNVRSISYGITEEEDGMLTDQSYVVLERSLQ